MKCRQISRQKAEKPDEFYTKDKHMPALDTCVTQGTTQKLEDKPQETAESVNDYDVPSYHDVDNLLSDVAKSANKTADYPTEEQSILETKRCPTTLQYVTNERYGVGSRFSQEEKQKTNRPLFLMVNEKRLHALPIDTAVNVETASSPAQPLQCYNVQIPVVAYRDIPLQISSEPKQVEKDVEISSVCQNDSAKNREIIGNVCIGSMKNSSMNSFRDHSRNESYSLDNVERCKAKSSNDISENKSISKHCDGHHISDRTDAKGNIDSSVSANQDVTKEIALGKDRYENCDAFELNNDVNNGESFRLNFNIAARSKNFASQSYAIDSYSTNREKNEREILRSSERKMAKTLGSHSCINTRTQNIRNEHDNADKCWRNVINDKILAKSTQSLAFSRVANKEYSKSKKEKHGELRINVKRKAAPTNLSRKAKSFFRKKSRSTITDSDCTLILPGYRGIKGKRYEKTHGRSKVSKSLHGRNRINGMNSILVKYNTSKQDRINSRSLTNLRTGNSFEKPSSIPLETRELLNKSYWEYYWRLQRNIKSDNTNKRDESNEDRSPESLTLQQCSVLSCMINTTLRDSTRASVEQRPSSDPPANAMSTARENIYKSSRLPFMSVKKIQRKRMKRTSKRLLGLRAIALLCIAMYVAVIFLPVMYDYFFEEEYDQENTNYIELIFQYVASSFEEAVDKVIDILTTIFLRPVRFNRKR